MSSKPDTLRGREVVVAGGSGGLGSALVDLLLEEGARVVVGYRSNHERAERWRGAALLIQADLSDSHGRARLLDAAPQLYGLVVFAGDPARVPSADHLEAAMLRSYEVNYLGPSLLAHEAANRMRAAISEGAIVLISTMQANALFPGSTAYAAQKGALQLAARILAKETRGKSGVRVNVVSPGVINAGMARTSIASGKYDRYIEEGVISRFGRAEDIARAARFFLEPDNYVTGQVLCVDGGMTL
jgi:3-oxoacyl-[acyl-carrier protein] reductase